MEMRKLPGTDVSVSSLCLGTMNFGQQCDEANSHEQMDYAVANGINFLDTAEMYPVPPEKEKQGMTEEFVGRWLKKSGKRDQLVIATKVSSRNQAGPMRTRDATAGLTRENIFKAIDGSLSRLGIDHVDLYQVHTPERHANFFGRRGVESLDGDDGVSIEETLSALSELVKIGKVRHIGVSNETPWGLNEYLRLAREKGLAKIVTIQNNYGLLGRGFEVGLSEICLREGVGLLPYSILNRGVIAGKYLDGAKPPGAKFTLYTRDADRYNPARIEAPVRQYMAIAKKHGLDVVQMAIAFCLQRAFIPSVIIAATKMEQLKSDIEAADIKLSDEVFKDIADVYREIPDPTA
jgi:aryl-alcohol dehydrogenase-like predicted oxidoreductase